MKPERHPAICTEPANQGANVLDGGLEGRDSTYVSRIPTDDYDNLSDLQPDTALRRLDFWLPRNHDKLSDLAGLLILTTATGPDRRQFVVDRRQHDGLGDFPRRTGGVRISPC